MIVLYDDAAARAFEPFATTRPFGEMRAGALLGRERWAMYFGASVDAFVSAAHLAHFVEFDAPPMASLPLPTGAWLVNSRALPALSDTTLPEADVLMMHGRVAAVRLRAPLADPRLVEGTLALEALRTVDAVQASVDGVWIDEPWDIIRHLTSQLVQDIPMVARRIAASTLPRLVTPQAAVRIGEGEVFVESGAQIEPLVVFDTTNGPVLVRRGATVQAFTRIIGPCYIGRDSIVTTDRIAAASIGDQCRVHGELSTTVFVGHANKGHDGFVGHSILGRWVNLGAGTITSNLKNTYGTVAMWTPTGVRDTGLQFAGTFFGDHAKTGIGLRLTTGCVLGAGANVMDAMPPKAVAPFSWGARPPYERFDGNKFLETAERVMARRQVACDAPMRRHLETVMRYALGDTRWPGR
jgi:UDP-N-acetylglucosamine diphosphorylase/glucosamine-1-phosphate N-acetyltransferase